MRYLDGITDSTDINRLNRLRWKTEEPAMLQSMGLLRVGHDLATENQQQKKWFKSLLIRLHLFVRLESSYSIYQEHYLGKE